MRSFVRFAAFAALCLVSIGSAFAQQASSISPAKQQLVREYLAAMDARETALAGARAMLMNMDDVLNPALQQIVQAVDLTGVDESRVKPLVDATRERMKARLMKAIEGLDWDRVLFETFAPLLDRYFTDSELDTLTRFLKTPVGQKYVKASQSMMSEAMQGVQDSIGETAKAAGMGIGQEEGKRLYDELQALKTK